MLDEEEDEGEYVEEIEEEDSPNSVAPIPNSSSFFIFSPTNR